MPICSRQATTRRSTRKGGKPNAVVAFARSAGDRQVMTVAPVLQRAWRKAAEPVHAGGRGLGRYLAGRARRPAPGRAFAIYLPAK